MSGNAEHQRAPWRLEQFFESTCDRVPDAEAVWTEGGSFTYGQLEATANRLAHHLRARGVPPGSRVGLVLERSRHTYVAVLGVLKAGLAFVPIDPTYPAERVAFIVEDAAVALVITAGEPLDSLADVAVPVLHLDRDAAAIATQPDRRLPAVAADPSTLCYVIYTSGSTGRPKGVAVSHASITNFIAVVREVYGIRPDDRVYQGMTIAFDFSIEEIWPAWAVGATVVAGPTDARRLGHELGEFLAGQAITVLCVVPTLLATIDVDLPALRTLLVGGEACPPSLVEQWSRPGLRMLNTYGPTEATVTATWTELVAGRAVTIGRPLPTYGVVLCDEAVHPVPSGEIGEICISGPGVALGYLNRPDLTAERFVPDPGGPAGGRLYRTGDLGRLTPSGEIEYLGRADGQIKIRGHRMELAEIEAVLLEDPLVENAVVGPYIEDGVIQDLVAYVTLRHHIERDKIVGSLHEALQLRLPPYMVPAYVEILDELPRLAGDKVDRKRLPPPCSPRVGAVTGEHVPPASDLERDLAALWAEVLHLERVSVEADFFLDLGGHSLFAAKVISRLRTRDDFDMVSIADLYANPTIRSLATHLEQAAPAAAEAAEDAGPPEDEPAPRRHTTARVLACGAAQLAILYALLAVGIAPAAVVLVAAGGQLSPTFVLQLVATVAVTFLVEGLALPLVSHRVLVRSLPPGRYPLWGAAYLRVWLHRKLLGFSLLRLLSGSPLMNPYLRLLGARVGRDAHIATARVQLPHLVEIGEGAHVGYGVGLQPLSVRDGWFTLAPVVVERGAFVGNNAEVLGGAVVGANARLAEQSLLGVLAAVPAGQHWHGSPARPAAEPDPVLDAIAADAAGPPGPWPRRLWVGYALGVVVLTLLPFAASLPGLLLVTAAALAGDTRNLVVASALTGPLFVAFTCLLVATGKRAAVRRLEPGIHPLRSGLGLGKWLADQLMASSLALTNSLYATLYCPPWLRLLGARIGPRAEVSTVSHIDPELLTIGPESFVADIASIGAATFDRHRIALGPTTVGRRSFVGNAALVRSHSTLGDNTLIGVQSIPAERAVEDGTNWLGSPALYLPTRQVAEGYDEAVTYRPPTRKVAARLAVEAVRVNLPATLVALEALALGLAGLTLARDHGAAFLAAVLPAVAFGTAIAATLTVAALKWMLTGRYRPRTEPMWSFFVWRSELATALYEGVAVPSLLGGLTGTPFAGPVLRLFGARIGRRVWLDTTFLTEFDLVRVGDDAAIGENASLQTHLFEDRVMKMSTVHVDDGASVGSRAVVLYDSCVGSGAQLEALSLNMKGESLPPGTRWHGIPAARHTGSRGRRPSAGQPAAVAAGTERWGPEDDIRLQQAIADQVGAPSRAPEAVFLLGRPPSPGAGHDEPAGLVGSGAAAGSDTRRTATAPHLALVGGGASGAEPGVEPSRVRDHDGGAAPARRGRFLAAAAAAVVLMGVATAALGSRGGSRDLASSIPDGRTSPPLSSAPLASSTTQPTPTTIGATSSTRPRPSTDQRAPNSSRPTTDQSATPIRATPDRPAHANTSVPTKAVPARAAPTPVAPARPGPGPSSTTTTTASRGCVVPFGCLPPRNGLRSPTTTTTRATAG